MDQGAAPPAQDFGFDTGRLERLLLDRVPGLSGPMAIERVAGGQSNPTFFLSFANRTLVLRKQPPGRLLPSAHAIDREFRVLTALAQTEVPVPRALLFHSGQDVVGTPFYLMERLDGRVFHDSALPGLGPDARRAVYFSMAETLAKLHALDPAEIGLQDFGRAGDYFERQIARWSRQWAESPTDTIPALDDVADWLPRHVPPPDGRLSLVHGDFRLGNLMIHETEPRVVGVLDWELSTLGHPLGDLGFCCMAWHTRPEEYAGIMGLDLEQLGLPTATEFVDHYMAHAAPTEPLRRFHVVFALFRFAVILVGIADRAKAGNAASDKAGEVGRLCVNFAERARDLALSRQQEA